MATTWRLLLQGEMVALQHTAELFPANQIARVSQESHEYFLDLPAALDAADDQDGLALGRTALDEINAIARLMDHGHRPVRISGIARFDAKTGAWRTTVHASLEFAIRLGVRFAAEVRDANEKLMPAPPRTTGESPGTTIVLVGHLTLILGPFVQTGQGCF